MKNIVLLIAVVLVSISCSSDSGSTNNNGNSFTNSMDYEFTITINGEVHKVKGNTTNGIPYGTVNAATHYVNNSCIVFDYSGQKSIQLRINDVTAANYISGQNMFCGISTNNLLLGNSVCSVYFNGSYFTNLFTSLGTIGGVWQTVNGPQDDTISGKLPITITDLGTGTLYPQVYPLPLYYFGQTLKGNYNGTIYLSSHFTQNGVLVCDIPIQLSIDFKVLRMY